MRSSRQFTAALAVLFGFLIAAAPLAAMEAGVAETPFILPAHVPLAGYSRRHGKPSTGMHDPVGVRALVMSDGATTVALVSCDLLIIDELLSDAVRRRLIQHGWPAKGVILLAATHTHSGPGAYGTKFLEQLSMGHFSQPVFDALVDRISETVVRAHRQQHPARIGCGSATTHGLVTNRMTPNGRVETELSVCAVVPDGEGQPLAILVDFSAHPTTLGAWNHELSADYPGVIARQVRERYPKTVPMFFAGSVGDQAPTKDAPRYDNTERIGRALAEQVVTLVGQIRVADSSIQILQEVWPLPPARVRLGSWTMPRWLGQRFVDDDATLTVVRVGQTVLFGVPCDLSAELGGQLHAAARGCGCKPIVIGFANDYIGYCLSAAAYTSGAYEAYMVFNGPQTGERLVEQLLTMLQALLRTP